jgi:hypothetical protein
VLDIAANWLSICSESHERCKDSNQGTPPTRLVSIAGDSPRLVLTANLISKPRYATLSHSWGAHDITMLTSEHVHSFQEKIQLEKLPKTFQDAITIVRRFGLDYLWIDSLCIIQDDENDWLKESSLMSSVYGNSTITIAASSARDSSQGCFLKQHNFSGGLRARITDGGRQRVQDFRCSEVYELSTFKTHLGSRAWALQEKMLPPRTIHFSDRGAFWECRTTIASEYLPDGFPNQLVSPLVRREGELVRLWQQIVRLYSAAKLSFGKDKLPALSGIARLVYNETDDGYLAGLWRRKIEEQLCWSRFGPQPAVHRPHWRAPTWSWASIDGAVSWYELQDGLLETKYAHVLDASTEKYGQDPFGQVISGVLRLACSNMVSGSLIHPENSINLEAEGSAVISLQVGKEYQEFSIQLDCLSDNSGDNSGLVYLLPLLGGKTGSASREDGKTWLDELMIEGIALRTTGVRKGEFTRVGSFNFYQYESKIRGFGNGDERTELYEPFLRVLEEHGSTTAESACVEVISNPEHVDERFVITII